MHEFEAYLASLFDPVAPSKVKDAMMYSLLNEGKRIRPKLVFATLQAYGIKPEKGFAAAAAIEMIHTYSLIHDDLPAMDNDTLRRGKPTCHVQFDEATAILAGDGLLTMAFSQAVQASEDAKINCAIVKEVVEHAGANGMILGQIRDIEGEKKQLEQVSQLQDIHIYKTGKLLTLPLICGALLSNHGADIDSWKEIGKLIGLSFQIQDDVLDVTATTEELGKNANSDLENNKATYVRIMGIQNATKEAIVLFDQAKEILSSLNIHKEPMEEIFQYLIHRKK